MSVPTEKLRKMLDAIIDDKHEEAQIAFHDYLGGKMKQAIRGDETPEGPKDNEDKD